MCCCLLECWQKHLLCLQLYGIVWRNCTRKNIVCKLSWQQTRRFIFHCRKIYDSREIFSFDKRFSCTQIESNRLSTVRVTIDDVIFKLSRSIDLQFKLIWKLNFAIKFFHCYLKFWCDWVTRLWLMSFEVQYSNNLSTHIAMIGFEGCRHLTQKRVSQVYEFSK